MFERSRICLRWFRWRGRRCLLTFKDVEKPRRNTGPRGRAMPAGQGPAPLGRAGGALGGPLRRFWRASRRGLRPAPGVGQRWAVHPRPLAARVGIRSGRYDLLPGGNCVMPSSSFNSSAFTRHRAGAELADKGASPSRHLVQHHQRGLSRRCVTPSPRDPSFCSSAQRPVHSQHRLHSFWKPRSALCRRRDLPLPGG